MAERILDIDQYNKDLKKWGRDVRNKMRSKLAGFPLKTQIEILRKLRRIDDRKALNKSVNARFLKDIGVINAVRFTMPVHGIFIELGYAGKNRVSPRKFIQPIIDAEFDRLEQIVLDNFEEGVTGTISAIIPGVEEQKTINFANS